MKTRIIITAALTGMLAVIFGAFGAHALRDRLSVDELEIWKTAVSYQFYHTIALLFLALANGLKQDLVNKIYGCFIVGMLFFCGSLYLLSTRSLTHIGFSHIIGPITPIGGLLFIAGWIILLIAALKRNDA
ncbi:DUF423 domain-containing protein [Pedobacter sp. BS3]|uniref:DUF423 domain-containing protein n=1 Tax=Pedobacter sp. BS3 TaxID=2567937 RepID=UPI0011EF1AF5|nr:DUF423 domain-containing protein [Pedobacter sp. BS3]TZF84009.1 DUF423 domain-containing protein [Pedobacter sp. BS3]